MKPRGPLMIEHRLIEKMLKEMDREAAKIRRDKKVDPVLIDTAVDFIRVYADRTHHGKEEDILFKELAKKTMTPGEDAMMRDLVDEHVFARKTVGELVTARNAYAAGDKVALDIILDALGVLLRFYPEHIRKEDKEFFPSTEKYFTPAELDSLLEEFWKFDREMIHEKYKKVVRDLESR